MKRDSSAHGGEWHSTGVANDPDASRSLFLHLMDKTPVSRMVVVRYPALKQALFQSSEPLTAESAYSDSAFSRTGHHNDCFLSSANDVGTYNRGGLKMADELTYLETDTLHTLFGGESCALHARSLPDNAIPEMERLHVSYLNSSYHPDVLQRWRDQSVMDTIEKRMGARFVLESLVLPNKGTSGKDVTFAFTLTNHGFASLYNTRPVFLVLRDAEQKEKARVPLAGIDPRLWKPSVCTRFAATVTLPKDLPVGEYSWHLHLPDASPRLASASPCASRTRRFGMTKPESIASWPTGRSRNRP